MNALPNLENRNARLANTLGSIAIGAALLAALALALTSLFAAAEISPAPDRYKLLQINIFAENELTNLVIVLFGIAALALIGKIPVTRRFNFVLGSAALLMLGVFGLVWVLSVNAKAESDGAVLLKIASSIIAGDYSSVAKSGENLHYYLVRFPYQCGLLAALELLVRLFGENGALFAARILNVCLLISSYAALLMITDRVFHNERITFLTILLLCVAVQPLIACTFVYGLIPALAFCIWGIYFVVRFLQDGKWICMIPAAILFAFAALVRSNAWIAILAVIIVLILSSIRKKTWLPVLLAVLIAVLSAPLPQLAQSGYEKKLDTSFGIGYPKSYWIAMSLQDGWKASGWHVFEYQSLMEKTYGEDVAGIDRHAKGDIQKGLTELAGNPNELKTYLFEKMVSQWNEPTFMSVWITKSVDSYAQPGDLTKLVYSDSFDTLFRFAEGKIVKILYLGFMLCAASMLRKRTEEQLLLPLILLGGVLFHMIFEAKSQYVLEYLPLLAPVAAFGIFSLSDCVGHIWRRKFLKRENTKRTGKEIAE